MNRKNYLYIIALMATIASSQAMLCMDQEGDVIMEDVSEEMVDTSCMTQESCSQRDNGLCKCYCAFEKSPRDWKPDDVGIFVSKGRFGPRCYCKDRDLEKAIREDQAVNPDAGK